MGGEAAHDWDFYLCRVDDAAASIFLDLALIDYAGTAPETTLYVARIDLLEAEAHGMGGAAEAALLHPIEDAISADATQAGFVPLGRLRSAGRWQIAFMGPDDCEAGFESIVAAHVQSRAVATFVKRDPEWSYYRELLYPDDERRQWIFDRRVVEALEAGGDPLTEPRRVDHWLYFESEAARAAFTSEAVRLGFEHLPLEPVRECCFALQLFRVDSVQLEEIHDLTQQLWRLAQNHRGEYDGWETSIEKE